MYKTYTRHMNMYDDWNHHINMYETYKRLMNMHDVWNNDINMYETYNRLMNMYDVWNNDSNMYEAYKRLMNMHDVWASQWWPLTMSSSCRRSRILAVCCSSCFCSPWVSTQNTKLQVQWYKHSGKHRLLNLGSLNTDS